jgi:hypothetical protein
MYEKLTELAEHADLDSISTLLNFYVSELMIPIQKIEELPARNALYSFLLDSSATSLGSQTQNLAHSWFLKKKQANSSSKKLDFEAKVLLKRSIRDLRVKE